MYDQTKCRLDEFYRSNRMWRAVTSGTRLVSSKAKVKEAGEMFDCTQAISPSAVFPLQLLGFNVDIVNSVQFSNHTGYRNKWKGTRLSGEELLNLIDGMEANGLLSGISHLLTGYVGTDSFLRTVADILVRLRKFNPHVEYFCDPVLGDHGKLYVPKSLVDIYRDKICPLASVVTPNHFELECLTGRTISSEPEILNACDWLHGVGVTTVVVTSSNLHSGKVVSFASQRSNSKSTRLRLEVERLDETFTGSGDLVAALLLGWMRRLPDDFLVSCQHAMAGVAAVLRRTADAKQQPEGNKFCDMKELMLIESASEIINPPLAMVKVDLIG